MKTIQRKLVLSVLVMLLGLGATGVANAEKLTLSQDLYTLVFSGQDKSFSFLVDQFTVPPAVVNDAILRIDALFVDSGSNTVIGQRNIPLGNLNDGTGFFGVSSSEFNVASLFSEWDGGYLNVTVHGGERALLLTQSKLFLDYTVPVPEAGTLILFGSALVGLVGYRRARRMI